MQTVLDTPFILASEVWTPGPSGDVLLCTDGVYGPLKPFGAAAEDHGFARGEGLPGRAWAEGRPLLLSDLADPAFARGTAAAEAGLAACAAIPVFAGPALKGVLLLFCGREAAGAGAIEIWRGEGDTMTLDAGFYGKADAFRTVSEQTTFAPGQGLPGGVRAADAPILMRDLGHSAGFVRAAAARDAGLTTGLGLPVPAPAGAFVLTLLSGPAAPLARRFEIWEATPARPGRPATATLVDGLCDREGPLWGTDRRLAAWQGPVGRALATGAPVTDAAPGFAGMAALPHHQHGEVARIAAWYF